MLLFLLEPKMEKSTVSKMWRICPENTISVAGYEKNRVEITPPIAIPTIVMVWSLCQ